MYQVLCLQVQVQVLKPQVQVQVQVLNPQVQVQVQVQVPKLQVQVRVQVLCFHYKYISCLLYTSPSPRDGLLSRMPSSA